MGMTIAEKIIAAAAGVPEVKPGDIHTVTLDRLICLGIQHQENVIHIH